MMKIWFDGETTTTGTTGTTGTDTTTTAAPTLAADFDFSGVLPADLKDNPALAKFSSHKGAAWAENVSRSLISAQGMIGADPNELVRVPADISKITAADRTKFMQRVGLPADEKAYTLKPLAKPIDGLGNDSPIAGWFSKAAKEQGVFPDQAQALYEGFAGQLAAQREANRNAVAANDKANVDALQKEFGKAWDGELKAAQFGITKLAEVAGVDGTELKAKIRDAGLGTDLVFFKAMAKFGKMTSESTGGGDKGDGGFNSGLSPADANRQGTDLLRQAMAVMDTNPSEAKRLNAEAQKLFAQGV